MNTMSNNLIFVHSDTEDDVVTVILYIHHYCLHNEAVSVATDLIDKLKSQGIDQIYPIDYDGCRSNPDQVLVYRGIPDDIIKNNNFHEGTWRCELQIDKNQIISDELIKTLNMI